MIRDMDGWLTLLGRAMSAPDLRPETKLSAVSRRIA
jgi:hypothetical protein